MTNLFKYVGITSILLFSFYYTEKMSNIVVNNSTLVKLINENSSVYEAESVSATIDGEYIIPGLNGEVVNVLKSYNNMKALDTFNSYYLVFDTVMPDVSLENNLDKIVKYANSNKNSVAILVSDNLAVINYAKEANINITRLVDINTYDSNASYEQINNDFNEYKELETLLNKDKLNKNICLINKENLEYCRNLNKYLVEYSMKLTNYNLANIKNSISSGYIIVIDDNVNISDFKILVKQIFYQDLNIVSLSKLISEERN